MEASSKRNDLDERLVCAVLAAQVVALRDRMDPSPVVDLLWRTTDMLSKLADLMAATHGPNAQSSNICATISEISRSLDDMAFIQAQSQDFARQVADCIVVALEKLAAAENSSGSRLSPDDLAALYVSEDQRAVHDAVAQRFGTPPGGPGTSGASGSAIAR